MMALNQRAPDLAYQYANQVADLSMRVAVLGSIPLHYLYNENRERGSQILAEAAALYPKAENNEEKAIEGLDLVYASAQIDLEHGFADMQAAVEAINAAGL